MLPSACPLLRQADEFAFSLPALGALSELKVGHDGRKDWHLDRVEVSDRGGTTCFFPCGKWVKGSGPGGAMARSLQLRGYTSDPGSLPVQYRAELAVRDAAGKLGPDSLRLALFGARGESGVQHLDASHAAPGSTLACVFQAPNVGQLERLRIGLAAADDASAGRGSADCALLLSRITVTNLASGEAVSFSCAEWLRATDPYDFELDAEEGQVGLGCTALDAGARGLVLGADRLAPSGALECPSHDCPRVHSVGRGGVPVQAGGADQRHVAGCHHRLCVCHPRGRRLHNWWAPGRVKGERVALSTQPHANPHPLLPAAAGPYQLSNTEAEHFQRVRRVQRSRPELAGLCMAV